jgi:1-hydroxycarotenoid 3,4-desaturase
MTRALVIGGGVGGLAAAIRLARAGHAVTLFERADTVGGKLGEVDVGGVTLPAGPSVLTMRWVFDELFDGRLADYLTLEPLEPLCRHFFPRGGVLDLWQDADRSAEAIAKFASRRDADGYLAFRRHAARIYDVVREPFMERPVPGWSEFLRPRLLVQMPRIDALRTLWSALEGFFVDPRLRQLFARYATYNGSSPYHAPATLAVIAHVENEGGVFAVKGGIGRLAEALAARARELGVSIVTGAEVSELLIEHGRAVGVRIGTATERGDLVVANCDTARLHELLGSDKTARKYSREQLSLSAFLLLCAARPSPLDLAHHDVFFSADYPREFAELVDKRCPVSDPTVYLCAPAPGAYFFLANAPPQQDAGSHIDWARVPMRQRIVDVLARFDWRLETTVEKIVTPADFAARFPGSRGALYGLSSNSKMAAFKRPTNRVSGISRLYAVGGTVHPGAGMPMAALSAKIAVDLALADLA